MATWSPDDDLPSTSPEVLAEVSGGEQGVKRESHAPNSSYSTTTRSGTLTMTTVHLLAQRDAARSSHRARSPGKHLSLLDPPAPLDPSSVGPVLPRPLSSGLALANIFPRPVPGNPPGVGGRRRTVRTRARLPPRGVSRLCARTPVTRALCRPFRDRRRPV